MTIRIKGAHQAVGYWGRDPNKRIRAEQISEKVLALNIEKIRAMGLPLALWMEVGQVGDGRVSKCTCVGPTTKHADRPCMLCYGIGRTPGFAKFGTTQVWAAAHDTWVLSGIELATDFAPFHLALSDSSLSGTAVCGPIPVSTSGKLGPWEWDVYSFCRDGNTPIDGGYRGDNSLVVTEWSADGASWRSMSDLTSMDPDLTGIYFRVSIARDTLATPSPRFGIVRARYPRITDLRRVNGRPEVDEPIIRAIEAWDVEAWNTLPHGHRMEATLKMWTLPLGIFDPSLDRNAPESRIRDVCFVEHRFGLNKGARFPIFNFHYSDRFDGVFTRQEFDMRRSQGTPGKFDGEMYGRVW